jgi:hypothetical protein
MNFFFGFRLFVIYKHYSILAFNVFLVFKSSKKKQTSFLRNNLGQQGCDLNSNVSKVEYEKETNNLIDHFIVQRGRSRSVATTRRSVAVVASARRVDGRWRAAAQLLQLHHFHHLVHRAKLHNLAVSAL